MGRNKDTMKKNSESLSLVDKEVGVEKNSSENRCRCPATRFHDNITSSSS